MSENNPARDVRERPSTGMDVAVASSPRAQGMISRRRSFKSNDRLYDIAHENYFKETSLQQREENYKKYVPRFEFGEMIRRSTSLCGLPGFGEQPRPPSKGFSSADMVRRNVSVNNLADLSKSPSNSGSFIRPKYGMRRTSSACELAELSKDGKRMA